MSKLGLSLFFITLSIVLFFGCNRPRHLEKETIYTGIVVESNGNPLYNVKVYINKPNEKIYKTATDSTGRFETAVDLYEISDNDRLLLDGEGSHILELEFKGIGKKYYDYNTIELYNSQLEALPKVLYAGQTYYINADIGGTMSWASAQSACLNLDDECNYGCNDWFVPNRDVILTMFENKDSIGGFFDTEYWTNDVSSDGKRFYYMDFSTGELLYTEDQESRFRVRPVRKNSGAETNEPIPAEGIISNISATSATYYGNILSNGGSDVSDKGVCLKIGQGPTINDIYVSAGAGIGDFTCQLNNLQPKTIYHVRAYAINDAGKERYGSEFSFETKEIGKPTVITVGITNISENSATVEGNVTSNGGGTVTERGICWSATNTNPTISDNHISNGNELGQFFVTITELESGRTYYVSTYAQNSAGTSYGNVKTFTTASSGVGNITVTTLSPSNITNNSATLHGRITFDQHIQSVDKYGFCYGSTTQTCTVIPINDIISTSPADFSYTLAGINSGTTYNTKAYAVNSNTGDTIYGETKTFSTPTNTMELAINGIIADWSNYAICSIKIIWDSHEAIEYGVCWSKSSSPTIDDNHTSYMFTPSGPNLPHSSIHDFLIDGLAPNTTYHIKAFAVTSQGNIYYGDEEKTFKTKN